MLDEWVFGCQRSSLSAEKENRQRVFVIAESGLHIQIVTELTAVCADGGKFRDYLDVQAAFRNYENSLPVFLFGRQG